MPGAGGGGGGPGQGLLGGGRVPEEQLRQAGPRGLPPPQSRGLVGGDRCEVGEIPSDPNFRVHTVKGSKIESYKAINFQITKS